MSSGPFRGLTYRSTPLIPSVGTEFFRIVTEWLALDAAQRLASVAVLTPHSLIHRLEGPADELVETFERIVADSRHAEVTIIDYALLPGEPAGEPGTRVELFGADFTMASAEAANRSEWVPVRDPFRSAPRTRSGADLMTAAP